MAECSVPQDYTSFLMSKQAIVKPSGIDVRPDEINPLLFPFQRDIVRWSLKLGRAALFEECGLGKTFQYLEWARLVHQYTGGKVLILAPLAVGHQIGREALKLGFSVPQVKQQSDVGDAPIVVTNYERLHLFDATAFIGVVLDESSILKAFTGKTKQALIDAFRETPFKLCSTATPAPNDYMELTNHSEFLRVMPGHEMLARWFINDTMSFGTYRLKAHAEQDFWRWLTSWAVCLSRPADLGPQYDIPNFDLPPLNIHEHRTDVAQATIDRTFAEGMLLPDTAPSSTTLHRVKRESLTDRVAEAVSIVAAIPQERPVIIWCDTNYEADALMAAFPGILEVRGDHSADVKEERLTAFSDGNARLILTKPDIAGFGLNWQHCADQVFVGVSFSFEKTYQALRRSWRFGQTKPVEAHLIYAETEGNVLATLKRKQEDFKLMQQKMNAAMNEHGLFRDDSKLSLTSVASNAVQGANWTLYLGDCVTETAKLPDNSIDFGIHSPPFANTYIYSSAEADMGNCADDDEFFQHYEYLIKELYRITRPGRLCAVHCKDLPLFINRDDAAGLRDFPGHIIRAFEANRWIFHSRVTIWKDPVIEMQRTKNHGLLHKNFVDRAEAVRQGMADYLLLFRKWPIDGGESVKQHRVPGDYIGTNPPTEYDTHPGKKSRQANYSIAVWQRYASPVWFDIDMTNVLNYQIARDDKDEKHMAPLQLDVIARAVDIWTNPGDTVFSPFAGVGSEGFESIKLHRKFIGVELKESYFNQACKYLRDADQLAAQVDLFTYSNVEVE